MGSLKKLQEEMSKELEAVSNEISSAQRVLNNLIAKQEQLKGAVYALGVAQSELDKETKEPTQKEET